MTAIDWLMYANITVWVTLCSYLFFIGYKQIKLEQRIKNMECLYDK